MKKVVKLVVLMYVFIILLTIKVNAHGGNITGWKDKNSDKIIEHEGAYYGYHKQDGVIHYHQVEWNEEEQKWEIVKTAVYYDENFNVINNFKDNKAEKIEVKYSNSVDGDTAKFELNGEIITVRFLGIDTPETVHPTKGEEPFGKEASNFTKEKLQNAKKIEIEYDENAAKTDKYDRHLAWIWVDDTLLQDELIKNGLAKTYMLQDNYKYAGTLQESERNAEKEQKGIWSNETESNINQQSNNSKTNLENIDAKSLSIIGIMCLLILSIIKKTSKRSNKKRKKKCL